MKTKTFDCVEMKRKGAEEVMKKLQGMNAKEQLEYWAKGTKELKEQQQKLRSKN